MAGVTYLIRVLPFAFFRKKITSPFIRAFLGYVPYAVLSAMTFPAVFASTGDTVSAAAGTSAALISAYFGLPLVAVAVIAAACAYIVGVVL